MIEAQQLLLGRRSPARAWYPDVWDVFGGHVEPGEHPEQALVRELREELGITPTRWVHLEQLTVAAPDGGVAPSRPLTVHLYRVTAWAGTPMNRQPDEHAAIRWFSLGEAVRLDLAHPAYPRIFARYLAADAAG